MGDAELINLVRRFFEAMLRERATLAVPSNGWQAPADAIAAHNALQAYVSAQEKAE